MGILRLASCLDCSRNSKLTSFDHFRHFLSGKLGAQISAVWNIIPSKSMKSLFAPSSASSGQKWPLLSRYVKAVMCSTWNFVSVDKIPLITKFLKFLKFSGFIELKIFIFGSSRSWKALAQWWFSSTEKSQYLTASLLIEFVSKVLFLPVWSISCIRVPQSRAAVPTLVKQDSISRITGA